MKEEAKNTSHICRGAEAKIALCKCKEAGRVYGVRMERDGEMWNSTWAFPVDMDQAKREGYDTTVLKGMLDLTEDYNGCPYCGSKTFIVCEACKRLNCNIVTGETFTCGWCGNTGTLVEYDGAGVASGGDLG